MKRGDHVWHKVFGISGTVLAVAGRIVYVRWLNGAGTECNASSLLRVSL